MWISQNMWLPCSSRMSRWQCMKREEKLQHFYQLVLNMVWDLWRSYARTFRCLALLQWERSSGKSAMWAIVGSNLYCSLLNSKSPSICIVGKQQKDHKSRSLNYYFFANQRVLFFAMPFLPHKGFANRPFEDCQVQCLWSRANCQVQMFLKQPNRQLQQLLAVENKTILQQPKPSTFYIMFHLTSIFYPHYIGMRSQILYTNGSFEICQERMIVKQCRTHGWSTYLLSKNIFMLKQKLSNLYMMF